MPRSRFGPGHRFLPQSQLLNFEEIFQVARQALALGVRTLRLTGGEPLLRRDLHRLIAQLAALRTLDGTAFLMLREGVVHFEGSPQELQTSSDPYLREFLS